MWNNWRRDPCFTPISQLQNRGRFCFQRELFPSPRAPSFPFHHRRGEAGLSPGLIAFHRFFWKVQGRFRESSPFHFPALTTSFKTWRCLLALVLSTSANAGPYSWTVQLTGYKIRLFPSQCGSCFAVWLWVPDVLGLEVVLVTGNAITAGFVSMRWICGCLITTERTACCDRCALYWNVFL